MRGWYVKLKRGNPMRTMRQVLSGYMLFLVVLIMGATPLLARDGHLKLQVTPKEASVYVDGVPLGWGSGVFWATPGEHTLSVYNYGYKSYSTKFTSESGKTNSLSVALEPVPGSVSGPWGRIELKGQSEAAVLLNGTTPDFLVGHVDEFNNDTIWKQQLLVPPGNHQINVFDYAGAEVYSGPVVVGENQKVVVWLRKSGVAQTSDWPAGKSLTSPLPRFKAGIASATVAVAKPTGQLTSSPGQVDCGGTSQLKWSTTEAPRVEIAGVGEVAASGEQTVQPKQTTAYKLTAAGPGGVVNSEATVTVNSNIQSTLSVTPAEIRYHKVGDKVDQQGSATISWSAPGADTVSLDPFGSVSPTGERTVQPTPNKTDVGPIDETITYALHSSNACGGSDTRTASLHIVGSIESGGEAATEILLKLPGNSIYFPFDLPKKTKPEGGLVESQRQMLEQLVSNFKQYLQFSPDAHLILEGHADRRGSVEYNMALSQRRADRVQSFLIEQGINAANLQTKAFGKGQNMDAATVKQLAEQNPNLTDQDRKKINRRLLVFVLANNRRVDIVLSTTGKKSLEYYPYNAADLKALLAGPPVGGEAPKTKTEVKK
jgi:outer membrane protein OmpA-like peptidoglycan-associated protein